MSWFKPVPKPDPVAQQLSAWFPMLANIEKGLTSIMAGLADIQTAQAATKYDLAALVALITQLLTAFASGSITPAQAQSILDEIQAEDATVKSSIATISAALPPA